MECSKPLLSLILLALLSGRALAQSTDGCDIYAPTPSRFIEDVRGAETVFVGRVAGFRMDDTTLAKEVPDCPLMGGPAASEECLAFWGRVVSVQYLIEAPITGVEDYDTFESLVPSTTDPCDGLAIGQLWLVNSRFRQGIQLTEMPSMAVLASLRQTVAD